MSQKEDVSLKYAYEGLLELVPKCPVCLELPKGQILMCKRGHSLCQKCRQSVKRCPICRVKNFTKARNFVAEELASGIATKFLRGSSTQTDEPRASTSNDAVSENYLRCRIGNCEFKGRAECLVIHVVEKHETSLLEKSLIGTNTKRWNVCIPITGDDLILKCECTCLLESLGLFFITIKKDQEGDVLVMVEAGTSTMRNYQYNIILILPGESYTLQHLQPGRTTRCCEEEPRWTDSTTYPKYIFKNYYKDGKNYEPFLINVMILPE